VVETFVVAFIAGGGKHDQAVIPGQLVSVPVGVDLKTALVTVPPLVEPHAELGPVADIPAAVILVVLIVGPEDPARVVEIIIAVFFEGFEQQGVAVNEFQDLVGSQPAGVIPFLELLDRRRPATC